MIADYINNYAFDYVPKQMIFLIIMMIIGYKLSYTYIFIVGLIICLFILYFFRRKTIINKIENKNNLVSPASGKIIKIQERDGLLQVSIFINLWDAHIQYVPYNGFVQSQIYKKGEFNPAYLFKKGKDNEKLIHNIRTDKGLITVVQIAGVIARSIEKFIKKGNAVTQCDELGLIRFGSRCDVFIPTDNKYDILVKEGQRVYGGETSLLKFYNN